MKKYMLFLLPVSLLMSAGLPMREVYTLSRGYSVTIDGTSNLRNWKETVGAVTGEITAVVNADGSVDLASIRIKMEVLSIKSDMGRVMDKKTYEGLKATTYPNILFTLSRPLKMTQVWDCKTPIPVQGNLTLAGVSKPVTMQVNTFEINQGTLAFEGFQTINMTDYGVKPPSALFGTMRAGPDITIRFKTNFNNQLITNNLKN